MPDRNVVREMFDCAKRDEFEELDEQVQKLAYQMEAFRVAQAGEVWRQVARALLI